MAGEPNGDEKRCPSCDLEDDECLCDAPRKGWAPKLADENGMPCESAPEWNYWPVIAFKTEEARDAHAALADENERLKKVCEHAVDENTRLFKTAKSMEAERDAALVLARELGADVADLESHPHDLTVEGDLTVVIPLASSRDADALAAARQESGRLRRLLQKQLEWLPGDSVGAVEIREALLVETQTAQTGDGDD